jgi:exopolyphosphatase/guanosine-5'-triphosphate,3'-diphosphate pyrophosphatase
MNARSTTPEAPAPAPTRAAPAAPGARVTAVIDIGSTAARMEIAEIDAAGTVRTIESLQQPVQLGRDTFAQGRIQHSSIEECVNILKGFRRIMDEYGVTDARQIRAVATSSVREAVNRDTFLDRIYMATKINVEAIEEAEETRLTYLGVQDLLHREPDLQRGDVLVVEVGGGDTELLLVQDGYVNFSNTYRLGVLRLRQSLDSSATSPQRAAATLAKQIQLSVDQIRRSVPVARTPYLIAVSGDARFAAAQLSKTWKEDALTRLDVKAFSAFARKIAGCSTDELVREYRITYQEAETMGAALLAYAQLAKVFQAEQIIVHKSSLRYGLLQEVAAGGGWTREFYEQVIHSTIALGVKYAFDEKHARHVAELSLKLFRELQGEHMLGPRYELLLHVAALLHEIGLFVSNRSHHKHSMYLILNSDIFGVSRHDMTLAALVARYHRRAMPQNYHEVYSTLQRDDRLAVAKMAAILRVADALERNHMQQVRDIAVTREKNQFVIQVRGIEDLALERMALKEKGSMFEEVYGLKPVLREVDAAEGISADV